VLAHANASFDTAADVNDATIDFGIYAKGSGTQTQGFFIANLNSIPGFTARLDLDSIGGATGTGALTANLAADSNIAPGGSANFSASLNTASVGSFSTAYTIANSDENLPGAASGVPLTMTLRAQVALAGDANLDNVVDTLDFNALAGHFGLTGAIWQSGDFNRDRVVDTLDFNSLAADFGQGASASIETLVPEPTNVAVILLASITFLRRRK
jgi:hypothetical protein